MIHWYVKDYIIMIRGSIDPVTLKRMILIGQIQDVDSEIFGSHVLLEDYLELKPVKVLWGEVKNTMMDLLQLTIPTFLQL